MIRGILFAEFDNDAGPIIRFQAPSDGFSIEKFDLISEYVITRSELCHRIVTVALDGLEVAGFPVRIENKKYPRNALMFNVAFVFSEDFDSTSYFPLIRKVGEFLKRLELQHEFLFCEESRATLSGVLQQLLTDLNEKRECFISIDPSKVLCLKLLSESGNRARRPVADSDVVVPTRNLRTVISKDWDVCFHRILPYIDGANFLKGIAVKAGIETDLARQCVEYLYMHSGVEIVDLFQFSNIYSVSTGLSKWSGNATLQERCVRYIHGESAGLLTGRALFTLYSAFKTGCRVDKWAAAHSVHSLQIDIRRFVQFGVLHKLLRRVRRFPVLKRHPEEVEEQSEWEARSVTSAVSATSDGNPRRGSLVEIEHPVELVNSIAGMLNGSHHCDAICVEHMIPFHQLEKLLKDMREGCVVVVRK